MAPTPASLWHRWRGPLAALGVLLAFAAGYTALHSSRQYGPLDPRSTSPDGARAVARLLSAQGVTIERTSTTDRTAALARRGDTTVLVTDPELLSADQLRALRDAGAARIVLLAPGGQALSVLASGVGAGTADAAGGSAPSIASSGPVTTSEPGCSFAPAVRAGAVQLGGAGYVSTSSAGVDACYPFAGGYALIRAPRAGRPGGSGDVGANAGTTDTVVLGSGSFLENGSLDQQGNASLALQLLGAHRQLLWYLPSLGDGLVPPPARQRSLVQLLPSGWRWGLLQAAVAALLAALWRARRLGPVVPEPLPVIVRAAETTEGRARLYRRGRARGHAAAALRQAARDRLAPPVGCAADAAPDAFSAAVADRLPRPPAHQPDVPGASPGGGAAVPSGPRESASEAALGATEIRDLLFGAAPSDDAALVRLAHRLDALERQVHHP